MAGRARQAIQRAFLQLLEERPVSQITVRDIVDACGLNRNTFYYHFQDLPHLVEAIVEEEGDRLVCQHPSVDSVEECLMAVLSFALEHRRAVLHLYHSAGRDVFERYQWRICGHVVATYVDAVLVGRAVSAEDRGLLIDYFTCMCFGFAMGWLESGMQEQVLTGFRRICALKRGDLEEMIARCETR